VFSGVASGICPPAGVPFPRHTTAGHWHTERITVQLNLPVSQQNHDFPADQMLVSMTDNKGIITHCNQAFVITSGFSYEALIGQNHNLVRHPDMPPGAYKDLWQTVGRGRSWTGLVKNRRKGGDHARVSNWPAQSPWYRTARGARTRATHVDGD